MWCSMLNWGCWGDGGARVRKEVQLECILKTASSRKDVSGLVGWWHGDTKVKGHGDSLLLGQEHREQ